MRVLLLVDLSYQVYRASAAHPNLTSRRVFTGGLYGFLTTLAKTIRETRATDIVLCEDRRPYLRSETYPEYKQLRKKNKDDELLELFKESMPIVREVADVIGLPRWGVSGFESDDLIAHAVRRYRGRFAEIYAASNDSDLYQMFWCEKFRVYRSGLMDLMNGERLLEEYGLTPDQFMLATALQGTHNDIAGIPKVGKKRAADAAKDPALLRRYMADHRELIARNLDLIRLPHPQLPEQLLMPRPAGPLHRRDLVRALALFDIETTGAMEKSFERVLEPYISSAE